MFTNDIKGVASAQRLRQLNIAKKTALSMLNLPRLKFEAKADFGEAVCQTRDM